MIRLFPVLLLFFAFPTRSQNLIPNASFETHSICPSGLRQINLVSDWYSASNGTPEYLNSCDYDAHVVPKEGTGFAGFIAYAAYDSDLEYLAVKLKKPLQKGQSYCFSFYLYPDAENPVIVNRIGAYFSQEPVKMAYWKLGNYKPQVLQREIAMAGRWTRVNTNFIAEGGEEYLCIGNFFGKESVKVQTINRPQSKGWYAYYYLDDFVLVASDKGCESREIDRLGAKNKDFQKKLQVYFASDEFTLSLTEENKIQAFIQQLPAQAGIQLLIEGHTDSDASEDYNEDLSLNRVEAVSDKLSVICTYPIIRQWNGERRLINASITEEEKYLNRRVEITVIP